MPTAIVTLDKEQMIARVEHPYACLAPTHPLAQGDALMVPWMLQNLERSAQGRSRPA